MTPETIIYKQSTASDAEVLAHLFKCDENFIAELSQKTDMPAYSNKIVSNSITFEAWKKEELVALVAAYFNDEGNKKGFITNVSTVKKFSGKGIATNLMKQCIAYAGENNFGEIWLEVSVENKSAVKLYEKNNFINVSVKDGIMAMQKKINKL
jgi:ribosomal protein S18 acetylase RimI-like enzyme